MRLHKTKCYCIVFELVVSFDARVRFWLILPFYLYWLSNTPNPLAVLLFLSFNTCGALRKSERAMNNVEKFFSPA